MGEDNSTPRSGFLSLGLKGFRGFRTLPAVSLTPLTFLVGPNSSGKSSLSDALMLLAQSSFSPAGTFRPQWMGQLVDLGSFSDTVFGHSNTEMRISVRFRTRLETPMFNFPAMPESTTDSDFGLEFVLSTSAVTPYGVLKRLDVRDFQSDVTLRLQLTDERVRMRISGLETQFDTTLTEEDLARSYGNWNSAIATQLRAMLPKERVAPDSTPISRICSLFDTANFGMFLRGIQRVSSGRGGPTRWYSPGAGNMAETSGLFDTINPRMVVVDRSRRASADIQKGLSEVLKDLAIADQLTNAEISLYHTAIKVRDSITGIESNLMEVGYGASQVIPVVRACLSGSLATLFVEQPEIHLHPKAQGTIAELLCETSRARQVIVETHSVHMINRARLWIARGKLPPGHVSVLFVERTKRGSRVRSIPVQADGDFGAKWPGGFFDERYEDTLELLRIKQRRQKSTS
jgi:hypothetical protein